MLFIKSQQLESSFGSETAGALKNHNDASVCGCNDAPNGKSIKEDVLVKRQYYFNERKSNE